MNDSISTITADEFFNQLCERIAEYKPKADFELIRNAYELSKDAHTGQLRKSGEEYIFHPLNVAMILAGIEIDSTAIAAALLHDVVEDTEYTKEDIVRNFGEDVCLLVEGVTKLGSIQFTTQEEAQVENIRKMFLAMAKDVRVILIKLADRLHNMRTLKFQSPMKQRMIARETLEVYAPLAHRLGMSQIKWELEDLALRYLDPIAYQEISDGIKSKRQERERYIEVIKDKLQERLQLMGIKFKISGRAKHFYSIYKKMYGQHKSLDEIYDLFAVRVIVDTITDCYSVLGMVHEEFTPIPGRVKDYIAMPKPNMYQSLHTTVIGPEGTPFEIQIRTFEMHKVAELGIAAHWKYKEGINGQNDEMDSKLAWIRQMLELQKDISDEEEFMKTFKIDIIADEVFVFTPKGDVRSLPVGSTPIDFAFAIHSAIGYKMAGAKANGKIVPLDYELQNGDIVDILTNASVKGPSRDWLKIAKTSQARSKINLWFKRECREENVERGKDVIEKDLKRLNMSFQDLFREEWLEPLYRKYNVQTLDDIYAMIGYGGITSNKIISRLLEEYRKAVKAGKIEPKAPMPEKQKPNPVSRTNRKNGNGIIVEGIENCLVRFAKCCNPVPGDAIIGYITKGRGVSVHRNDCVNVVNDMSNHDDGGRLINVFWDSESTGNFYNVELNMHCTDRRGLLSEIIEQITGSKFYITGTNTKAYKDGTATVCVTIEVSNIEQINTLTKKLMKIPGVEEITRNQN